MMNVLQECSLQRVHSDDDVTEFMRSKCATGGTAESAFHPYLNLCAVNALLEESMKQKEIMVPLYLKNVKAVCGLTEDTLFMGGDATALAEACSNAGADAILVFDRSEGDAEHDAAIGLIREITRAVDVPVYGGGNVRRVEDVKKLIYAGCRKVFLNYAKDGNVEMTQEVSSRFGKEKMLACIADAAAYEKACGQEQWLGGVLVLKEELSEELLPEKNDPIAFSDVYCVTEDASEEHTRKLLTDAGNTGTACAAYLKESSEIMELKHHLKAAGISVNTYESSLSWQEIRTNSDGLLPVVVQDYKTQEVLMVAYMNQEAFELTVRTGRMTYWSRSRKELWVKGLTSGHFQYVKELCIDCDNDTLLAKVAQVGAACHTGNRSCFYRTILKKEYDETNPMKVFEDVYAVIEDRKIHPKEGSYTNYLFDKGIDKILKKVGEEATEIIIAAKNPDPEEIKYEISDFLYHVMVLMAERGVTWEEITRELAQR